MWDSPAWLGTLISGKINSSIAKANRINEAAIAEANRTNQAAIAEENRVNDYLISAERNAANIAIAEANRANDYLISSERNSASIRVAEIQAETARLNRESNEFITAQDRNSREVIAAAQRDNDYRIAQMKSGVDIINTGVRTVLPFALPFAFSAMSETSDNRNSGSKGPTINASAGSVKVKDYKTSKDRAREKAESLFPELEPTWSSSIGTSSNIPKIDDGPLPSLNSNKGFSSKLLEALKSTTAAFGAAVLTGVTLAPFITI